MMNKIHIQRKKFKPVTSFARQTKIPIILMRIAWLLFIICLVGVFSWIHSENKRTMARFQQSTLCKDQLPNQENCRINVSAPVDHVWLLYGNLTLSPRHGERSLMGEVIAVDLDIKMPDEKTTRTRISKRIEYQHLAGKGASNEVWFSLQDIQTIQKGDILTVSRWNGKIISVSARNAPMVMTMDHPENITKMRYPAAGTIFGILFLMLFVWTGYETLRKRR